MPFADMPTKMQNRRVEMSHPAMSSTMISLSTNGGLYFKRIPSGASFLVGGFMVAGIKLSPENRENLSLPIRQLPNPVFILDGCHDLMRSNIPWSLGSCLASPETVPERFLILTLDPERHKIFQVWAFFAV
jgi:hypothetical protein